MGSLMYKKRSPSNAVIVAFEGLILHFGELAISNVFVRIDPCQLPVWVAVDVGCIMLGHPVSKGHDHLCMNDTPLLYPHSFTSTVTPDLNSTVNLSS
jgi:hypothetical protein